MMTKETSKMQSNVFKNALKYILSVQSFMLKWGVYTIRWGIIRRQGSPIESAINLTLIINRQWLIFKGMLKKT